MEITRRTFLKLCGAGAGGAALVKFGLNVKPAQTYGEAPDLSLQQGQETSTICCYCSVGCGAIVTAYENGEIIIEGDPDHPINEGALCPKGQAMTQIHQVDGELNPYRLTKPLYRAPNSTEWEEKSWEWMIDTIAHRVKTTRDASWIEKAGRADALASLGGGELDNEECYVLSKMDRALGITYMEHCARL